jgi:uncharacterized membrane protein
MAPPKRVSGLAVASLVLGIMSVPTICCCGGGLVAAILAIIFGHLAMGRIRRSQGRLDGTGMAVAGLVIGYASVALQILAVIFLVASAILGPCAEHTHHFHWHHW